ncbi:MAG: tetratricopeptide repeat protein [Leptolyngbya sp. SIOISBB]|nr:tetratricopeptide repeat protein [Leptolyngbya sp. SIOISBB]
MTAPEFLTSPLSLPIQTTMVKADLPPSDLFVILAIAHKDLIWANHHYQQGQFPEALAKFEAALSYYTQAQETTGMGQSLNGLSAVYLSLGQPERSLICSQAAAAILEDTEAKYDYAIALHQLGRSHFELQHIAQAEQSYVKALKQFYSLPDIDYENRILIDLGGIYAQQHKFLFALACYESVLDSLIVNPFLENRRETLSAVVQAVAQLSQHEKLGKGAIAAFQSVLKEYSLAAYHLQVASHLRPSR